LSKFSNQNIIFLDKSEQNMENDILTTQF